MDNRNTTETFIKNEELFMTALEMINIGAIVISYEGKFLKINRTFSLMTGYSMEELPTMSLRDIFHPDDIKEHEDYQGCLLQEKRDTCKQEKRIITKDKNVIWTDINTTLFRNSDNTPLHYFILLNNITQRKLSEIALRESEEKLKKIADSIAPELIKAKEKAEELTHIETYFLDNMSHELRTPMIGILGFADILLNEVTDDSIREKVQIIYDSSQRMMEAVNLILDLSKLEAGKSEMFLEKIDISEVINKTCKLFVAPAQRKNLILEINSCEKLIMRTDEKMLAKIIHNLINNAIKYTEKGKIEINVFREIINNEGSINILVKDTGIGIPDDKLGIIFEPFRQVSEGTKRKYEGTGVGLTITKKLVELLNGKISVESIPDQGSIFRVSFPFSLIKSDAAVSDNQQTTTCLYTVPEKAGLPAILAIDDDLTARVMYKISLKDFCILDLAEDADTALRLINNKDYDIILMDINLSGGMNGLDLTKIIRGIEKYRTIPIIAATAYALTGDKESFLSKGCSHYLAKPFTKKTLLDLIKSIVRH